MKVIFAILNALRGRFWRSLFLSLLILVQLVLIYFCAFVDWQGPGDFGGNYNYVPAVMIAAGKGLKDVEIALVEDIPALDQFIRFESMCLDPNLLPEDMPIIEANDLHRIYQYLLYTVGYLWRVFGISWNVLRVLLVFFLLCCATLIYGISRLMLPPLWSLLVAHAFVWNSAVLDTMYSFRDFSKALFILSAVYILGTMIKKRPDRWRYIGGAVLIGAILGVGMGFRRDMQVILPFSLVILATCRLQVLRHAFYWRLAAVMLSVLVFTVLSSPILMNFYNSRWLNAHDTIMGFATQSDESLGLLEPASYEKHLLQSDVYTTYQVFSAFRYGIFDGTGADVTRPFSNEAYHDYLYRYILYTIGMFPADFLSRAYAAVLRSCVGVGQTWLLPFRVFEVFGLIFVGVGLMSIATFYPYRAWQLLLMLCLFCGGTSIQYGTRHAFHTTLIPYLFGCFVLYHTIHIYTARRDSNTRLSPRWVWRWALCLSLWTLVTGLAFWVPLKMVQGIQASQVKHLQKAYRNADRVSVPHVRISGWENGTLIRPSSANSCKEHSTPNIHNSVEMTIYVAYFDASVEALDVTLVYEYYNSGDDLGGVATCHTENNVAPGKISFYFPVYEIVHGNNWNMFSGLLMSDDQASHFLGYEKLNNISDLNYFLHLTVPENQEAFIPTQRVVLPWPFISRSHSAYKSAAVKYGKNADSIVKLLEDEMPEEAIPPCLAMLERCPCSPHYRLLLAHAYFLKGYPEKSWEIIAAVLADYGEDAQVYRRLDMMFASLKGEEERHQKWRYWLQKYPESECARFYYDTSLLALIEATLHSGNIFSCQQLIKDNSEFEKVITMVDDWLRENTSPPNRLAFWHNVAESRPESVLPYLHLGIALEHEEKHEEAADAYAKSYGNGPQNVGAAIRYATCRDTGLDTMAALDLIEKSCTVEPDIKPQAIARLQKFGGETSKLIIPLISNKEEMPDAVRAALLANLLMMEEEPNEASLLTYIEQHAPQLKNLVGEAMLEKIYAQRSLGNIAAAENMVFIATALIPSNQDVWMLYGSILESQKKVDDAKAVYRRGILKAAVVNMVAERFNGLLLESDSIEERVCEWKTLTEVRPDNPTVFLYYLNTLRESSKWNEMRNTGVYALGLFPENSFIALACGHALFYEGEHDEGLKLIEQAAVKETTLRDQAVDILIHLADGLGNNHAVREKVFALLARIKPEAPYFEVQRAVALQVLNRTDDAIAALSQAISSGFSPDMETAASYLNDWLEAAKRKAAWEGIMTGVFPNGEYVTKRTPEANIFVAIHYARALADTGQMQDAEDALIRLKALYPGREDIDLALGMLQCQQGDYHDGLRSITSILNNQPEIRPEVIAEMEGIFTKALAEERYADSESMAHALVLLEPGNPLRYFQLGEVFFEQQQYERALEQYEQVLTVAPESPRSLDRVETIFEALQQPETRKKFWRRLHELHPASPILKEHL
jgi:tetratricopeptide (TPR) repeat protein